MKKLLIPVVILLAALGAYALFSGRATPNAGAQNSTAGQSPMAAVSPGPSSGTDGSPAQSGRSGSVYYLNFKPEQAAQWEELARVYTGQTGVPVTVVTAASNTYETTLASEIEKKDAPTLFQVNGPIGLQKWAGYCADLKDTKLYQSLVSDEFALLRDEQVLGVAYAIESYGLIYNRTLLERYCALDNAVIKSPEDIDGFPVLKAVADDIQARKAELGVRGAFTSAGMDASSDWRFKTHLANLPIYYEYKKENITDTKAIRGTYLEQYKQIWDLYLKDSTTQSGIIGARTGEDALAEFTLGEAVFYQNGTWAYEDCIAAGMTDRDLDMLPIYIGAEGEEDQGLCTGSENYWCINKNAPEENIRATKEFLDWVITSDEGREAMANRMGFVTPFQTFDQGFAADNALIRAANRFIAEGKTPVSWNFTTMPSEQWKNDLGAALLEYAQGTAGWDRVETAFVEGWAKEYAAAR